MAQGPDPDRKPARGATRVRRPASTRSIPKGEGAGGAAASTARPAITRVRDGLFDYPIPLPSKTVYDDLGIGPDATEDEIRFARSEATKRFEQEEKALRESLDRTFSKVAGLREAYDGLKTLQLAGGDADTRALGRAQARVTDLERAATVHDPEFKAKLRRVDAIARRGEDLNRLALDTAQGRLAYDRKHPPLALLRLEDCTIDGFVEPRTALVLLRGELSRFLEARGERVRHPSDLTRERFDEDFQRNPLLDGAGDD